MTDLSTVSPPAWDLAAAADLCLAVQSVPAPTFDEGRRAEFVARQLRAAGLADVAIDPAGPNVVARWPGRRPGKGVLVSAHLDTVFPAGTPLDAQRTGLRLAAPGIGDNSLGVTGLILLAQALARRGQPTAAPLWLVANAAEEGLGDLKGMRRAVDALGEGLAACVVIEGSKQGAWPVTHLALGSRRYRIHAQAPGGHSWGDFGKPSALHLLVRLAAELTAIPLPVRPRCSFNIGELRGGTSVNSIAEQAELLLDLRSESPDALSDLAAWVEAACSRHQAAATRQGGGIGWERVGDRPAGGLPVQHPLVRMAVQALKAGGVSPERIALRRSSTDANLPLARGLPAVTIHLADGGDAHRLDEWVDLSDLGTGMDQLWRLVHAAAAWVAEGALTP
ncbi:MAG TPA: M20/M25/M40 family metallo-hydrolase [Anaerolineae bacterium]|nr:M20/M25/M40 family metallo-hydrolase [Anaerolineae bacterium]